MSRAYRIRVSESLKRVLRAHDRVSTQLELLEVLPPEQMGQLLAAELEGRGFRRQGSVLRRSHGGVSVTIDTDSATVTVEADASQKVKLEGRREGLGYDDVGPQARKMREALKEGLRQDLEKKAQEHEANLQAEVSSKLEGQLADLRAELDQAVNRVTAEALKCKAAQMGRIKEITEDAQSGSLTIVLEV